MAAGKEVDPGTSACASFVIGFFLQLPVQGQVTAALARSRAVRASPVNWRERCQTIGPVMSNHRLAGTRAGSVMTGKVVISGSWIWAAHTLAC
jgi:hypothetical protein